MRQKYWWQYFNLLEHEIVRIKLHAPLPLEFLMDFEAEDAALLTQGKDDNEERRKKYAAGAMCDLTLVPCI